MLPYDREWSCRRCLETGADIHLPHYHTGDDSIVYLKESHPLPRPRTRVPRAFREDLIELCNSGRATAQRIIDLIDSHGLKLVRQEDEKG